MGGLAQGYSFQYLFYTDYSWQKVLISGPDSLHFNRLQVMVAVIEFFFCLGRYTQHGTAQDHTSEKVFHHNKKIWLNVAGWRCKIGSPFAGIILIR